MEQAKGKQLEKEKEGEVKLSREEIIGGLREMFCEIDSKIRDLYIKRGELQEKCPHQFDGEGFAVCSICGRDFGSWVCNASPDKICHYNTDVDEQGKRYVELRDRTRFYGIPVDHDPNHESDDWCIFCGLPDERK